MLKFVQKIRPSQEQLKLGYRCNYDCNIFYEKLQKSRHLILRFIAGLSVVRNTE